MSADKPKRTWAPEPARTYEGTWWIVDTETGRPYVSRPYKTELHAKAARADLLRPYAHDDPWRTWLVVKQLDSARQDGRGRWSRSSRSELAAIAEHVSADVIDWPAVDALIDSLPAPIDIEHTEPVALDEDALARADAEAHGARERCRRSVAESRYLAFIADKPDLPAGMSAASGAP